MTLLLSLGLAAAAFGAGHEESAGVSPENGLKMLREGNERYVRAMMIQPHSSKERRLEVSTKQEPFAAVLGCADSRVPVERIFDQGLGDLFVVRVAGNTDSPEVRGSLEYAVLHTGVKLLVVLGHESCGAVKAALAGAKEEGTSIGAILAHIKPAADYAQDKIHTATKKETSDLAVERNVYQAIKDLLRNSPKLAEKVKSGEIKLVGAVYDLDLGRVAWLGEHPDQKSILENQPKEQ
jgi:carbonic anhydrase